MFVESHSASIVLLSWMSSSFTSAMAASSVIEIVEPIPSALAPMWRFLKDSARLIHLHVKSTTAGIRLVRTPPLPTPGRPRMLPCAAAPRRTSTG